MSRKPKKRDIAQVLDRLSPSERAAVLEKFDRELEQSSKKGAST